MIRILLNGINRNQADAFFYLMMDSSQLGSGS